MCKICKLLYRLLPGRSFQAFLIKKHITNCSQCQKEIEEANNRIKETSIFPNWVKAEGSLWPQIRQKLHDQEEKAQKIKRKYSFSLAKKRSWAMACLFLAILIGGGVLIHKNFLTRASIEEINLTKENPRIRIKYAEIKGKKAKPYIYQTPKASFIWLGEENK